MSSRPTPFGLFAGVKMGKFTAATTLELAVDPLDEIRVRPDAGWVSALVKTIEQGEGAFLLGTRINPLSYRVGNRLILAGADIHGESDGRQIDIRFTPAVEAALDVAACGCPGEEIAQSLVSTFPDALPSAVTSLVRQLFELHVLTSDLRPPGGGSDPLSYLLSRLPQAPVFEKTRRGIAHLMSIMSGATLARDLPDRMTASHAVQTSLAPDYDGERLHVDSGLAMSGTSLAASVGDVVADVADVLMRIGTFRSRPDHLIEYHDAFLERYGLFAEVPILDLLSPERGLEAPRSYERPRRTWPLQPVAAAEAEVRPYDFAISALTSEVLHSGKTFLELTDARLEHLTIWRPGDGAVRPTIELLVQICAPSRQALDSGDFRVVATPGSTMDGGRTFGRFADLFDEAGRRELGRLAAAEEAAEPGVRYVCLTYQTPQGRSANVARHHPVRELEICVNAAAELGTDRQVRLADVVVGAAADRFYLRWVRTGEEIRVVQDHLLVPTAAPNVCRFLLEVSQDGFAPLPAFDWGPMATSPFLPRVTRGRAVLHPAQWRLTTRQLGGSVPEPAHLRGAIRRWRESSGAPRDVYLSWLDNRLLLDLEHDDHLKLLGGELTRAAPDRKSLVLQEMLPSRGDVWLGRAGSDDRFSAEVVVPLRLRQPEHAGRSRPLPAHPRETASSTPNHAPGGSWTCLYLYCPFAGQDRVLASLMTNVAAWRSDGLLDRWHFVRYGDPRPHLRLRFRVGKGHDSWRLLTHVLAWSGDVLGRAEAQDLAVVTWRPEVERYGGAVLHEQVTQVFDACSDSAAAVAAARSGADPTDADIVAAWTLHEVYRAWGRDALLNVADRPPAPLTDEARRRFREARPTLCALVDPETWPATGTSGGMSRTLEPGMARLRRTLADTGDLARQLHAAGDLVGDEASVVGSIAHMRLNRLGGIDSDRERLSQQLWWQTLAAVRRRRSAAMAPERTVRSSGVAGSST